MDIFSLENDSQKDNTDKFSILQKEFRVQEEELTMTRKELDIANQEIFNMRMKYSFLEKSYQRN